MIYLMMLDGNFKEFSEAIRADVEGTNIVCFDLAGRTVAVIPKRTVIAFGQNTKLKSPSLRDSQASDLPQQRQRRFKAMTRSSRPPLRKAVDSTYAFLAVHP